jgi:aspartyl protease family protein
MTKYGLVFLALAGTAALSFYVARRQWADQHPGLIDLEVAWSKVRDHPRDASAWATLGDAQAHVDQPEAAEQAYRTALRLGSDDRNLIGRLGFVLYSQGRDREAFEALQQARDQGASLPMLAYTLEALESELAVAGQTEASVTNLEDGPPPRQEARAECTVPVYRRQARGTFLVDARINDTDVRLIVDTGASLTTLAEELLDELGVEVDRQRSIHAITATGPTLLPTARVESLSIGDAEVRGLSVAVCDGCGGHIAGGLLGLDVQVALGLDLDVAHSRLRFVDCE